MSVFFFTDHSRVDNPASSQSVRKHNYLLHRFYAAKYQTESWLGSGSPITHMFHRVKTLVRHWPGKSASVEDQKQYRRPHDECESAVESTCQPMLHILGDLQVKRHPGIYSNWPKFGWKLNTSDIYCVAFQSFSLCIILWAVYKRAVGSAGSPGHISCSIKAI